jgi:hypothetical protein
VPHLTKHRRACANKWRGVLALKDFFRHE